MAETLYFDLKESFFTEKRLKTSNKQYTKTAQKVYKKGHKSFLHFTDTEVYKNSILLFHFFVI